LVIFVNDKLPQAYRGKLSSGGPKSDGVNFCLLKGGAMLYVEWWRAASK